NSRLTTTQHRPMPIYSRRLLTPHGWPCCNTYPPVSTGCATSFEHMNLAQSTVSKHLSFLLECGLITPRPQGRATWYALAEPALLKILVAAAEKMLDATGKSAQLCVHLRLDEAQLEEK